MNQTTRYETYFNILDYRWQLWNKRFEKITLRYIQVEKKYTTLVFLCIFSFNLF